MGGLMVSVIIPSYNRQNTIIKAVNSVLNQTVKDLEVIVVDDGSTDDTIPLLEHLNEPRLKILYQNHEGACAARNRGVLEARGEYIAFHDSDDICRPKRLETELHYLEKQNADFVCGNVLTHLDGKTFISPNYKEGWLYTPNDMFNITTMTFMGKVSVFKNFRFDPKMPRWQDLDLLLAMCGKVKIFFCKEILCDYYRDGDSMSLNPKKCISAYKLILGKYPAVKQDGGLLYSRLTKMYADSKVVLGRKDYYLDYKNTFDNNKTLVNLIWLFFARLKCAKMLYKILHRGVL